MASYTQGDYTHRVRLKNPLRTYTYPLDQYQSCEFDEGKHGEGSLTVQFAAAESGLPLADICRTDVFGWCVEVYISPVPGEERVVWSGPIIKKNLEYGARTIVRFEAETMAYHLLRRRLAQTSDNSKWTSTAIGSVFSGAIAKVLIDNAFVSSGATGWVPAYPTPYRNDLGPWYARWNPSESVPIGTASVTLDESPGNNTWDSLTYILEAGDLALILTETTGTAHPRHATASRPLFQFHLEDPWSGDDLTSAVLLSNIDGSLVSMRHQIDESGLANCFLMKGEGDGTSQKAGWGRDVTSWVTHDRGAWEDTITMETLSDSNALANERTRMLEMSQPLETFDIEINRDFGPRFNLDYFRRDGISVWHTGLAELPAGPGASAPEHSSPIALNVMGWSCSLEQGLPNYRLTVGDIPINWGRRLRDRVGQRGGFMNGGRFTDGYGRPLP